MCGIIGMITSKAGTAEWQTKRDIVKQMLFTNTLRGSDSTGIAFIPFNRDDSVKIIKKAVAAPDFLELRAVNDSLTSIEKNWAVIAHNRAATYGKVNNINAHPFSVGDITLVHNGSLKTTTNLPDHTKFSVDSENIAHAIDTLGIDDAAKLFNGAFALVWHDAKDNTINFLRNDERPLFFGVCKGSQIIYYASELGMLQWIASRNRVTFDKVYDSTAGCVITFNKDNVLEYNVRRITLRSKDQDVRSYTSGNWNKSEDKIPFKERTLHIKDIISVKVTGFSHYVTNNSVGRGDIRGFLNGEMVIDGKPVEVKFYNITENESKEYIGKIVKGKIKSWYLNKGSEIYLTCEIVPDDTTETNTKSDEHKQIERFYYGPGNKTITREQFLRLTKNGCCVCDGDIDENDSFGIEWFGDMPVCKECSIRN